MPGPRAAQTLQMPRSSPGGGGGWAQLELTDALATYKQTQNVTPIKLGQQCWELLRPSRVAEGTNRW